MMDKIIILLFIGISIGSLIYGFVWNKFVSVFGLSIGGSITGGFVSEVLNSLTKFHPPSLLVALLFAALFITKELLPGAFREKINLNFSEYIKIKSKSIKKLYKTINHYKIDLTKRNYARG